MNKKDLEKLGLTAEALEKAGLKGDVLDGIIVLHGKDIESHKTQITTLEAERDGLKTQLTDANTAIEGFKKLKPEELQKAADDWKAQAEKATKDAEALVSGLKFDHALEAALKTFKVKDPADVIPHLKRDALKLSEDGQFIGLKEQIEPLQAAKDYLFEAPTVDKDGNPIVTPKIVAGTHPTKQVGDVITNAARKAAGLPLAEG